MESKTQPDLPPELLAALSAHLLAAGDDELILGHRNSEWCGCAPILEEDIAFANLALDEIAHAQAWYALHAGLVGEDPQTYPDQLTFFRPPQAFRNLQMVELPKGDWAFSMLRQYFFDIYENETLEAGSSSVYAPLAETAARLRKEEIYHRRHSQAWVLRLGQGTQESHTRLQKALDVLWPYAQQLFAPLPGEPALTKAGLVSDRAVIMARWLEKVLPLLAACSLEVPSTTGVEEPRTRHTPEFKALISELQSVARLDPQATW